MEYNEDGLFDFTPWSDLEELKCHLDAKRNYIPNVNKDLLHAEMDLLHAEIIAEHVNYSEDARKASIGFALGDYSEPEFEFDSESESESESESDFNKDAVQEEAFREAKKDPSQPDSHDSTEEEAKEEEEGCLLASRE